MGEEAQTRLNAWTYITRAFGYLRENPHLLFLKLDSTQSLPYECIVARCIEMLTN